MAICLSHIFSAFSKRLSNKRSGRNGKSLTCHEGQSLNVHTYLMGCIGRSTKTCNCFRKNNDACAHEELFYHGGDTDINHFPEGIRMWAEAKMEFQFQKSISTDDYRQCNQKCNELSDYSCDRSTGNTKFRETKIAIN